MNNISPDLRDHLRLGIIQTTLDEKKAWSANLGEPKISLSEDKLAWHEIRRALRALNDHGEKPDIIILPELAIPRTRLEDFERIFCSMNVMAIAGVDYRLNRRERTLQNEGLVLVPRNFWKDIPSKFANLIWFGKNVPAPGEAKGFESYSPPWGFVADNNVYVFDAGPLGRIGVSICYDFMDLERALLYRGQIHHLVVIAYNRDIKMFESLAVSLSRTLFCNVIICNTGHYGGSLVVTPFYEAPLRIGYSINGGQTFSSQKVSVPIRGLDDAMRGGIGIVKFKSPPPGFNLHF